MSVPSAPSPPGAPPLTAVDLPDEPRRLHPVDIVFAALSVGPRDLVFGVVLVLSTGLWWLLVIVPVLALATSTLRWWRMTWWVDDERVIVDRGVAQRTHRELPIHRIQQIELIRSLRHQILGVCTLRIETAGGEPGGEVDLLLTARDAERIRAGLLARRDRTVSVRGADSAGAAPEPVSGPPELVLLHLGPRRLALAGLVGPQILALPVALVWLLSLVDDLPSSVQPEVGADDVQVSGAVAVLAAIVLGLALWVVVAMVAGILAHHDLTLSQQGGDLRLRRGLLDRREVSVPAQRVQLARLTEHPLLGAFGLLSLRLDSVGGQSTIDTTRITVPTLTRSEADRILSIALPEAVAHPRLEPAPRRALPRSLLRSTARLVLPAGLVLLVLRPGLTWTAGVLTTVVALGCAHGALAWRGLGAHISDQVIAARRGALVRTSSYVPTRKAQSARSEATLFQRRRRLVTAFVDVAGQRSPPALTDRDPDDAARLAVVVPGVVRWDEERVRAGTGLGSSPHPVA